MINFNPKKTITYEMDLPDEEISYEREIKKEQEEYWGY